MTIDEYFKKQTEYDEWEYVGILAGFQIYVFKNKADKEAFTGFPYFVKEKAGKFSTVTEIKEILKCNAFYNNSFPDTEEERKNK